MLTFLLSIAAVILAGTSIVLLLLWKDAERRRAREIRYSDRVDSYMEAIREDIGDARVNRIIEASKRANS